MKRESWMSYLFTFFTRWGTPKDLEAGRERLTKAENQVLEDMFNRGVFDAYKELDDGYVDKTKRHRH